MLGKIKELLDLKEGLDSLRKELDDQKKLVSELSTVYKKEINELSKRNKEQQVTVDSMGDELTKFKTTIKKEVEEFKALNKGTQKQLMERFEQELTDQFVSYGKNLEMDKTNYMKLKADIEVAGKSIAQLNSTIQRLTEVAALIKKEDFELTQHHKTLLAEDKNKRDLIAKIDTLERLMAAMQRGKKREEPRKAPYA